MWVFIIIGILFILLGLAVRVLKWYFLISGYNTMSKEKKAKVDIEGLGRLMGKYSYVNGGVFILVGVLQTFGFNQVLTPGIVFFTISTVYLLIKAQKFDRNIYDENGKLRKRAWKEFILPACIVIVTFIFVAAVMFFSSRSTQITFLEEGIEIHGMYGSVYSWDSIEAIKLMDELPTVERRTNGSALGSILKGHFRTKEMGSVKLFVDIEKPPFIYLETDDGITIFNMNDADETQKILKEIQSKGINVK